MSTPAQPAIQPSILDIQDKLVKDQATPPFAQPYALSDKARMYFVFHQILQPQEQTILEVGFIPDYWLIYARYGPDTSGYYATTQQQGATAIWQRADKILKIPGIGTDIRVQSDSVALEMYVVAVKNCDIVL